MPRELSFLRCGFELDFFAPSCGGFTFFFAHARVPEHGRTFLAPFALTNFYSLSKAGGSCPLPSPDLRFFIVRFLHLHLVEYSPSVEQLVISFPHEATPSSFPPILLCSGTFPLPLVSRMLYHILSNRFCFSCRLLFES